MAKLVRKQLVVRAASSFDWSRPLVVRQAPRAAADLRHAQAAAVDLGPYLDYSRSLTPTGGVLIVYKDLDLRWRQYVWKAFAWCAASGAEAWYVHTASPLAGGWLNLLCWLVVAALNLWISWQPVEVYRRLEIQPDCLILDGNEVFWRAHLAGDGPEFAPDATDNLILGGVYGTRFVEFATLRRFDECDRMPEAFRAHFAEAVGQLWAIA